MKDGINDPLTGGLQGQVVPRGCLRKKWIQVRREGVLVLESHVKGESGSRRGPLLLGKEEVGVEDGGGRG